jgi:hypothetical protein
VRHLAEEALPGAGGPGDGRYLMRGNLFFELKKKKETEFGH